MYFISVSFQHPKNVIKRQYMFKHKTTSKSASSLYPFLCTILPLCRILYIAAMPKGLLLGITYKNVSGGAVVGRFAVGRGKTLNTVSVNKVLVFV